jgi:hypothetical protein
MGAVVVTVVRDDVLFVFGIRHVILFCSINNYTNAD